MSTRHKTQMKLTFVVEDLSPRPSPQAWARAVELLRQMLADALLAENRPKEIKHDRQDPADPP